MNRILFVDDERNVLDGLRRMLYPFRKEWDMTFVTSGADALRCLSESPFEVLVTDIRMPAMDGIMLLREVVENHPQVVRMVLSGTADMELTLQSVSLAHQYLLKPCDAGTLRATLQRAFCQRLLQHNPVIRGKISRVQSLPTIPTVYAELVRVLQSDNVSPQMIGEIVSRDLALTAKLLQLVNSSLFGISREITSPREAAVYLGMETVQALVITVSALSQFRLPNSCGFSIEELQEHSLAVGALASHIAKSMRLSRPNVDCAFLGGLLHDIGKLVLVANYPAQYQEALEQARRSSLRVCEAETTVFGTSHAEVGAYLLWLWGLPEPVTDILAMHHRLLSDVELAPAVIAVQIANGIVHGESEREMDLTRLKILGLSEQVPAWRQCYQEMLDKRAVPDNL